MGRGNTSLKLFLNWELFCLKTTINWPLTQYAMICLKFACLIYSTLPLKLIQKTFRLWGMKFYTAVMIYIHTVTLISHRGKQRLFCSSCYDPDKYLLLHPHSAISSYMLVGFGHSQPHPSSKAPQFGHGRSD